MTPEPSETSKAKKTSAAASSKGSIGKGGGGGGGESGKVGKKTTGGKGVSRNSGSASKIAAAAGDKKASPDNGSDRPTVGGKGLLVDSGSVHPTEGSERASPADDSPSVAESSRSTVLSAPTTFLANLGSQGDIGGGSKRKRKGGKGKGVVLSAERVDEEPDTEADEGDEEPLAKTGGRKTKPVLTGDNGG